MTLDIPGDNYISWVSDAEIDLDDVMNLGDTIKEKNDASTHDCAKAMILFRHHLHE